MCSQCGVLPQGIGCLPHFWAPASNKLGLRGYEDFQQEEHIAYVLATAYERINAFKNVCRAVVARTLVNGDAKLLKPAASTRDCLLGLCVTGQHSSLMFNAHVSDVERNQVASAIVCLSRKVACEDVDDFLATRSYFNPRRLTMNGNM